MAKKDIGFLIKFALIFFIALGFLWEPMRRGDLRVSGAMPAAPAASSAGGRAGVVAGIDWDEIAPDIEDYLNQEYNGRHNGVDIRAEYGGIIKSESAGKVSFVGDQDNYCPGRGLGKFVMVENDEGYTLLYAHLREIEVSAGDRVSRGETLGYVGDTGLVTGPHLHFAVFRTGLMGMTDIDSYCGPRPSGGAVNPINYLQK